MIINYIKSIRKEKNISLEELSRRTDFSVSSLKKLENNVLTGSCFNLTFLGACKIAYGLNSSLASVFDVFIETDDLD